MAVEGRTAPADPDALLGGALPRAGDFLGLSSRELAGIVGVSASTLSRLRHGAGRLEQGGKPWELARLFIRLVVALGTLTGRDETAARAWFDGYNSDLESVPRERVRSVEGLVSTLEYVDSFVHHA